MGRHAGPLREEYTQSMSTIHDNFNIVCAIDIQTTGPFPGFDSIYEVCILPLGSYLEPYEPLMPYYTQIRPLRQDNLNKKKCRPSTRKSINNAIVSGMDYGMSIDMFDEWFDNLPLNLGKKIMPIAYNWPHTQAFLIDWLGFRHLHHCFDYRFRDILSVTHFLNDYADSHIRTYPFKKIDYSYICNTLHIEHNRSNNDTLENCVNIAEIYRSLIRDNIMHMPKHSGPLEDDPELLSLTTE